MALSTSSIKGTVHRYCRADVLRILRITPRQLSQWQKAGLVAAADTYSFFDLIQLKKVRDLASKKVRPAVIRESLQAMLKSVAGMENPLLEAGSFSTGTRIAFRHEGKAFDPIAGQFVMDFAPEHRVVSAQHVSPIRLTETAAEFFARGVSLEEDPSSYKDAVQAYTRVIELDPNHAAAHINLGTLYYNMQDYTQAEAYYRKAIEVDPRYALAYFDLANVLDETGRLQEAIRVYKTALQLAPTYADAHYNLALAYEKTRDPRKALNHWRAYIGLDKSSAWAAHARSQISRILENDKLKVVFRRRSASPRVN
jgi:tetratricopeptide (TPR) repeat protein